MGRKGTVRSGIDLGKTSSGFVKEIKQCQCTYSYYADVASHVLDQLKQRLRGHGQSDPLIVERQLEAVHFHGIVVLH
jgi:hypothetical protein